MPLILRISSWCIGIAKPALLLRNYVELQEIEGNYSTENHTYYTFMRVLVTELQSSSVENRSVGETQRIFILCFK